MEDDDGVVKSRIIMRVERTGTLKLNSPVCILTKYFLFATENIKKKNYYVFQDLGRDGCTRTS